ncbi:MAG: carbamoyltransferase [Planctomycetales bacterium]|nr:carbamoyltransferase [Planctomycetales bacterium]
MTAILGISAFYHDSAAALVVDGEIVAAAQEERFSRKKHDHNFPLMAIEYCLAEAQLDPEQLDFVGFYDKPLLKFERLLETYLAFAPRGFRSFLRAMPLWLKQKLYLPREIKNGLRGAYRKRVVFTEHHESHAASAFFPSPFDEAAILTMDGVGEWATASFGVGRGNRIEISHELHFPHSLGLLYSAFTYFCGFRVNSGEYKLMGLAPYGEPKYVDLIRDNLIDLRDDGSFRMDLSYFDYCAGLTMTSPKFDRLFGGPPRSPESPLTPREMDIAASIQVVTEEIMLRMARHVHAVTGLKKLCLAGGVALNCVGNGRILRDGPFDDVWIQPAAGDAGGALGTALFIWHQLLNNPRTVSSRDSQHGSLLGPRFSDSDVEATLRRIGAVFTRFDDDDSLCTHVAELIASDKVVGWVQGRMEFGPRALGSRSILGDARSSQMQSVMNLKIKFRESFRPFAPSVLEERVHEFFETRPCEQSPYMLLVAPVHPDQRVNENGDGNPPAEAGTPALQGIDKLKLRRSVIPAVTHVDYSARIQTVDADRHGRYYRLLKKFNEQTGCPVVINTSFNVRGEPIVCTPEDAYRCFLNTNMDVLVVERCVMRREDQPKSALQTDEYLKKFQLD